MKIKKQPTQSKPTLSGSAPVCDDLNVIPIDKSKLIRLCEVLDRKITDNSKGLERLREALNLDLFVGLMVSGNYYEEVARVRVFSELHEAITHPDSSHSIDTVKQYATDFVYRKAGHISKSSNPTSDLMERYELAAWVDVLELIKWEL